MDEDIIKERNSKYCYQNSNTLINKLEIKDQATLQKYEARITAAKLLALRQKGITGNFDKNHFVSIHKYIFEDIYPFAGKFRTENIAKGYFRFAEWEYIEEELDKLGVSYAYVEKITHKVKLVAKAVKFIYEMPQDTLVREISIASTKQEE